jgi:hypothetical protein
MSCARTCFLALLWRRTNAARGGSTRVETTSTAGSAKFGIFNMVCYEVYFLAQANRVMFRLVSHLGYA